MEEEIIYFYNVKDGKYYQSRYTHRWLNNLQQQCKKQKEVIDKANNKLRKYKNDIKEYQEQYRINHQNISIGLVGVKIRAFEDILKEVSE